MKVSLSQIKSWFKKGMYPTESQFANTFDSFWHKDDTLPLSAIQNLMQILNDKASVQLVSGKQDKTDTTLQTADKTVVGAINEVNTKTSNIEREIGNEDLLSDHAQSIKGAIAEINTWRGNASQDIEHLVGDMPFKQDKTDTTLQTADKTVVDAINEVNTKTSNIEREVGDMPFKQDKTDTTLQTADKTVVGAINEVNTKTSNIEREIGNEDLLSDHAQSIKGAIAEINTWRGNASQDIEHLVGDMPFKQDKTDNSLKTICKTIVGAINELWEKVEDLWEKYIRGIDKVTHAELVAMRDAGELIAGRRYRIIDFVTTTSQPDTRSAGHRFDIIVMADSSSTLNENATAIKHKFTEEELVVPTYFLWRSDNDADYGIITKVRVPQSLDDIVGRYTNDGEEYISNKMLGNYTELSSANEDEMLLKWLYTNEDDPNDTESGTDTYSFVSEISFDETDDPNYFADSKLNAWQLKYCLDNDITRYLYTDPEKGKGVIYYLEDEFGNRGDFDFKNIQHKRYKVTDDSADGILSLLDGQYVGFNADMQDLIIEDDSDYIWAFSASMPSYSLDEDTEELNLDMTNQLDATLNRLPEGTGIDADGGGYAHPVIFCKNNRFVTHQISMSLDDGTWVYPYRVSNIVLFCYPKYFSGDDVIPARVEFENCSDNVLASDSDFITANSMFSRNTFLTANSNLIFGRSVGRTIFKGDCYRCTFGGDIGYTTFGGNLSNGHIHGYLYHFTIGKEGETWTNLVINPGVEYLTVTCSDTSEGEIKNVYIYGGVCGTGSETLTVIIPTRNNSLVEIKPTSKEEILV